MKNKYFLILLILLIPSIFTLLLPGFIKTDDGDWMVIRFSAFYQALRDGQFPVRFLERLNFSYGYPVPNFLYPGFMYLAVPIHILGFSFSATIKIILGLSLIASGIFTYFWLKKMFDEKSAFLGAFVYVYTPYHLYDVYKRGSVGEVLALAVLPFILWQTERKSFPLTALGIGLLLISHNTLAFIFLVFTILYMIFNILKNKNRIDIAKKYILTLILGIGLASFFWMPALIELKYTVFSQTNISNYKEYFADVNLIGWSTFLITILTLLIFVLKKAGIHKHRLTVLMLIVSIAAIFFSSGLSGALWTYLPVSFIQFPFRLLSLLILSTAFLAAFLISQIPDKFKLSGVIFLIIFGFISSKDYFMQERVQYEDTYYSTNEDTTTVKNEYMPIWVKNLPHLRPSEEAIFVDRSGEINNLISNNQNISFTTSATASGTVRINTIYYPGWTAQINGQNVNINFNNEKGVMDIIVPRGDNNIKLEFGETVTRMIADFISIICLVILIFIASKRFMLRLIKK